MFHHIWHTREVKRAHTARAVSFLLCCHAAAFVVNHTRASAVEAPRHGEPALDVVFFFTPGCRMCKPTKEAVRQAEVKYGDLIRVEWVDLSTGTKSAARLFHMLNEYGERTTPPLALFVGRTCLAGGERIISELDAAIDRELSRPGGESTPASFERVDRLGLYAISAAALADGVNPCAFATVVFLVSLMALARKTRGETLLIGGLFTAAVYATYFVIGIAFFGVLHRLRGFFLVSDLVFYLAFGACALFGLLSLYDASLAWRRKEPGEMLLKVPQSLRDRMHKYMRTGVRSRSLVAGTLVAGVAVSVLESACTGQVYFPVIAGMVRDSATRARGVGLLAWYNLLFVLPLLIVFGLAFAGVTSQRLAAFGKKHWGLTKLLLALVFLGMACWMAPGLVWPPGAR